MPFRAPDLASVKPHFFLELPRDLDKTAQGIPIVQGEVPVTIRLDRTIKIHTIEQRFEILCFVDFRFIREEEEGYSPCTWQWHTRSFQNGTHIITVNVAAMTGQVASASIAVWVEN